MLPMLVYKKRRGLTFMAFMRAFDCRKAETK